MSHSALLGGAGGLADACRPPWASHRRGAERRGGVLRYGQAWGLAGRSAWASYAFWLEATALRVSGTVCIVLEHRSACETRRPGPRLPRLRVPSGAFERLPLARSALHAASGDGHSCVCASWAACACVRAADTCVHVSVAAYMCVCVHVASHTRRLRTLVPLEGSHPTARQLARRLGLWPGRSLLHPRRPCHSGRG